MAKDRNGRAARVARAIDICKTMEEDCCNVVGNGNYFLSDLLQGLACPGCIGSANCLNKKNDTTKVKLFQVCE
jgi:hypothetical protein